MPRPLVLPSQLIAAAAAALFLLSWPKPSLAHRADRRPTEQRLVLFGAATEGSIHTLSELDRFEKAARKRVSLYSYYQSFHLGADLDADGANALDRRDAIPLLTWEPWNPAEGREAQRRYSLRADRRR